MISDRKQSELVHASCFDEKFEKHLRWLIEGPIRSDDGMLCAWSEGNRPSFLYEESTGYLLTLLCFLYEKTGEPRFRCEAERCARALCERLANKKGCGKNGAVYLFDTAICRRALGVFTQVFPNESIENKDRIIESLEKIATSLLHRRLACEPAENSDLPVHWSGTFNIHMIKVLAQLLPWNENDDFKADINDIVKTFIRECFKDGIFYLDDQKKEAYLHPHCYAVEGLLAIKDSLGMNVSEVLDNCGRKLASLQLENGGLPSCWPTHNPPKLACDTTSQAVRIWQILDADKYADPILRALDFVKSQGTSNGGVRYSSTINHLNSWTTIFYLQAWAWQSLTPDAQWII